MLLQATRSVEIWSSLFPRLISLSPSGIKTLFISVDQAVSVKSDFTTPCKSNSSTLSSSSNLASSFVADEILISSDNTSRITVKQIDLLLPLVRTRVDSLALRSENLRSTFNTLKSSVIDDLDKLGSGVSLLHDIIG